jgi:hypothetical protein
MRLAMNAVRAGVAHAASRQVCASAKCAVAAFMAYCAVATCALAMTPEDAARQLEYPYDSYPGGIYTVDNDYTFNVLDAVYYDAKTGMLTLAGHFDGRFRGPKIPYLQHLAALLPLDKPEFTLTWTQDSESQVDALLGRELTFAETDEIAARMVKMFDASGHVNAFGSSTLANLALSPIVNHRLPGFLGADVFSDSDGAVIVNDVAPGSPAEQAGLAAGDVIQAFNGSPPIYFTEFRRLVRFSGATSNVTIAYIRDGHVHNVRVVLGADADQDVWKLATRNDAARAMVLEAGETDMANALYVFGVYNDLQGTPGGREAFLQILSMLGVRAEFDRFRAGASSGSEQTRQNGIDFGRTVCSRMDEVFKLNGHPALEAFNSVLSQSNNPSSAVNACFAAFHNAFPQKFGEYMDRILLRPAGQQVPPEVINAVLHVHPTMAPEYLGIAPDTLLARAMFDGDYTIKRLANRPDLKLKFPRYLTEFEFEQTHPAFHRVQSTFRMWISVAKMDVVQSLDRKTLTFRDARMQFNMREQQGHQDLPAQRGGYEELLTSMFDDFEQEYPTLHELREASKLAEAAAWMHQQSPGLRLPAEGMVRWHGPSEMPGLIYQYLSSHDASYLNAKITWIAEGGVSLVSKGDVRDIPVSPGREAVDIGTGPHAFPQIPTWYGKNSFSSTLHRRIDVPIPQPLNYVYESHKGAKTIESVTVMLKDPAINSPACLDTQRMLAQAADLSRRLTQTEKAIHILAENNARRTSELEALKEELISDRNDFTKRTVDALESLGGKARKKIEKSDGKSSDTRLILKLFDRADKIAEANEVDSKGEVTASYGRATFNALADSIKDLIKEAPNNPARGEPTMLGTVKPLVVAIDDARLVAKILINEQVFAKLEFIDDFKVESMQNMQAIELKSLREKLEPMQRELSNTLDALFHDIKLSAETCRARPSRAPVASK